MKKDGVLSPDCILSRPMIYASVLLRDCSKSRSCYCVSILTSSGFLYKSFYDFCEGGRIDDDCEWSISNIHTKGGKKYTWFSSVKRFFASSSSVIYDSS